MQVANTPFDKIQCIQSWMKAVTGFKMGRTRGSNNMPTSLYANPHACCHNLKSAAESSVFLVTNLSMVSKTSASDAIFKDVVL